MKRGILIACLIGLVAAVGARAADDSRPMRGGMNLVPPTGVGKTRTNARPKGEVRYSRCKFQKGHGNLAK